MSKQQKLYFLLVLTLCLPVLLYFPGMKGDFVFDDSVNILENSKVAMTFLNYESLRTAWYSGDAGPLGRPISMLSFAINHYLTGFDPYYFKLTNFCIHLLNGVLIFLISQKIFERLSNEYRLIKKESIGYFSILVSLIWLIHPLNLTSVLYVVQRMTSLSTLFGLIAIVLYCFLRSNNFDFRKSFLYGFLIIISLIFSMLSKESGILFIILIYWIELIIFKGKNNNLEDIYIYKIKFYKILWLGVFIGFISFLILLPSYLNPNNFLRRDFTLEERLLTESRVIFYYLKMFFYPLLSDLSLYHDDFTISKSFFYPVTTLISILSIIFITFISIFISKKHPMIIFAWGWYIISQLLESTFISLELVHEHRNYFGIIGFIVTFIYYLGQIKNKKIKFFVYILVFGYISNLSFITWQRSLIWSNLVDHAAYEATMHPKSDRANYQFSRILINLMQNNPDKQEYYFDLAQEFLYKSKQSYMPANGAWFAELHLYSYLKKPINQQTVEELIFRLKNKPFGNGNISFLSAFSYCQIQGLCVVAHHDAVNIFTAVLDNPTATDDLKAEIYKLLAQYYVGVLSDFIKAEEFLRHAIDLHEDVNVHLLLAQIYRLQNKTDFAYRELQIAQDLDTRNIWVEELEVERRNIESTSLLNKAGE